MMLRPITLPLLLLAILLAACASAKPTAVTLRLVNKDGYAHAFDLDEFDIHLPFAANEILEVAFTPDQPGSYPFYCGSPGHEAAGMVGTLIVTP